MGGGDAAYDYALNLASKEFRVIILQRDESSCLPLLKERARAHPAIRIMKGVQVRSCSERDGALEIVLEPKNDSGILSADFMIIACGRAPEDTLMRSLPAGRPHGNREGLPPGVFTGGDLVRGSFRQAGIAVGDGLAAAMAAARYVRSLNRDEKNQEATFREGESCS
jgi:thioredoxin reductase